MPCVSHPSPTPAPVICLFWTKFPDLSLELASSMIGREHPAASCMSTCAARLSRPETRDTSPGQAGQSTFPHPALVSCASIRPPTPSNHRFLPASLQQIFVPSSLWSGEVLTWSHHFGRAALELAMRAPEVSRVRSRRRAHSLVWAFGRRESAPAAACQGAACASLPSISPSWSQSQLPKLT